MSPKADIDPNADTVIDLKGSKQHHNLKNQPGEAGDPNHADGAGSEDTRNLVKDAVADADTETELAAALKDAVD